MLACVVWAELEVAIRSCSALEKNEEREQREDIDRAETRS